MERFILLFNMNFFINKKDNNDIKLFNEGDE